ncbi:MAG: 2OG-Fe(II) oxygenase [Candidatus Binataceae bacterium]
MTARTPMDPSVIQIQRRGVQCDRTQIERLRAQFRDAHHICLPQLLEPDLVNFLLERMENAQWETKIHPEIAEEHVLDDFPALSLLDFVVNQPGFRELIEEVTDTAPLRRFKGRIYRMIPGEGHYDKWHTDVPGYQRLVGMTMNLSPEVFRGGAFVMREQQSKRVVADVANTGLADALIFRIAPTLEHRVADLEGDKAKTAFAGWFVSNDLDFFEELRQDSEQYRAAISAPGKPRETV